MSQVVEHLRNVADKNANAAPHFASERTIDELEQLRWAVISFDKCEGGNLSYENAAKLLSTLESEGVSGLCIVTDQVAARLAV